MMRAILSVGSAVLISSAAFAQNPPEKPAFEVASIKPSEPPAAMGPRRIGAVGGPGTEDPGRVTYFGATLRMLLMNAYDVKRFQISGSAALDSERYDIVAKVPKDSSKEQVRLMLQNLLEERFKLVLHRETKELPAYELLVAKGGPKFKESAPPPESADAAPKPGESAAGGPSSPPPPPPPPPPGGPMKLSMDKDGFPQLPPGMAGKNFTIMMPGRAMMVSNGQTMAAFADMLSGQLDRPVVDLTGLKGKYDFKLQFLPENMMGPMGMIGPPKPTGVAGAASGGEPMADLPDAPVVPPLPAALQAQLGLKLEPKKSQVEFLVVDHVEKTPIEN